MALSLPDIIRARSLGRVAINFTRLRSLRDSCSSRNSGRRDEEASPRRTAGKSNAMESRCDHECYDDDACECDPFVA